mgnify:CR=1 FL=1
MPYRIFGIISARGASVQLRAMVSCGDAAMFSRLADGQFDLTLTSPDPENVQVKAPGYEPWTKTADEIPESGDIGTVELVAAYTVSVQVDDVNGLGCDDASVLSIADIGVDATHVDHGPTHLGKTGTDGTLALRLPHRMTLMASKNERMSAPVVWYPGQPSARFTLGQHASGSIGVHDIESGQPVSNIEVQAVLQGGDAPCAFVARTASNGVAFQGLPMGSYLLRSLDPGAVLLGESRGANKLVSSHTTPSNPIVVMTGQQQDDVWLNAKLLPERWLDVRSSASGKPLSTCRVWLELFADFPDMPQLNGWRRAGALTKLIAQERGFSLAGLVIDGYDAGSNLRLLVDADGYKPAAVVDPRGTIQPERPTTILVDPLQARDIRLITSSGVPYPHPVWIRDEATHVLLSQDTPSMDGLVASVGLAHGGIIVCGSALLADEIARTSKHDVDARVEGPIVIRVSTGRILVSPGSQDPLSVHCERSSGTTYPSSLSHGKLVFESLPTGAYAVGANADLELESVRVAQGRPAYRTLVAVNRDTLVELSEGREPVPHLAGRVECTGVPASSLRVRAFYGDSDDPIPGETTVRSFPVNADGSFELWDLPRQPTMLIFGREQPAGPWLVLGVGQPNGPNQVRCGRVELRFGSAVCAGPLSAIYSAGIKGVDVIGLYVIEGTCVDGLVLDPVPETLSEVQVMGLDLSKKLNLTVKAGTTVKIQVTKDM